MVSKQYIGKEVSFGLNKKSFEDPIKENKQELIQDTKVVDGIEKRTERRQGNMDKKIIKS